jgi:hypothetical protein
MDSGGFGKPQKPPKVAKVKCLQCKNARNILKIFFYVGEKQNTGRNSNHCRAVAS